MKVLVVIDMQNDFITGPLGTKEAREILPRVIEKVKDDRYTTVYTRDSHDYFYLNSSEGKLLPVPHCIIGTDGELLVGGLLGSTANVGGEFFKSSFGCLSLIQELEKYIKVRNDSEMYLLIKPISEIVLVGVCTDICVITNALTLKTHFPEVKITVDASCCAGTSPEMHEMALKVMKQCQINIENWSGNDE